MGKEVFNHVSTFASAVAKGRSTLRGAASIETACTWKGDWIAAYQIWKDQVFGQRSVAWECKHHWVNERSGCECEKTCFLPQLQSCHRRTGRKKGHRESNGHRFFNLTLYRFLFSPPHWCPCPSAATDVTDREEKVSWKEQLVGDGLSVSADRLQTVSKFKNNI